MREVLRRSVVARSVGVAAIAAALVLAATRLPLVPVSESGGANRLVPLDTWAAAQFPGARDLYRARFAGAATPARASLVALALTLFVAAALSFPRRLGAWLARRVPPMSARALGLYRLALGVAMLAAWRTIDPPDVVPWDLHRSSEWFARLGLVRSLAASPGTPELLWQGASVALLGFAAGVWSRLSLIVAASLMTLLVGVLLTMKAMHDWGIPVVTLWVLVMVPWRDSVGVQTAVAAWRGRPVRDVAPEQRGLAVWLPGLTVGLAFAAAAFAKLDTSGLAWMTGGAVRYHFIEDAARAPVDWGLLVARSDIAASLLSFGAVFVEGAFWMVVLVRHIWIRLGFGLAAVGMLAGFYVLQGVFWPGWWALCLAFVPWSRLAPAARAALAPATPPLVPALQSALISLLVVQQPLVSALHFESEPFVSDYSMYSYTWPSKEAFDRHLRTKTARRELTVEGLEPAAFDARLRQVPRAVETIGEALDAAVDRQPWSDRQQAAVASVRREYQARFGVSLDTIRVTVLERGFDWNTGDFASPRVAYGGTLNLDTGQFHAPAGAALAATR